MADKMPASAHVSADERLIVASFLVRTHGNASASWLSRQLGTPWAAVDRLLTVLEGEGLVSVADRNGQRTVIR